MDESLKLKIDSSTARQDLAALEKQLDRVTSATDRTSGSMGKFADSANVNFTKAARAMEKYAQVAALLSKVKTAGNPAGQMKEMAQALDAIGRARAISPATVTGLEGIARALRDMRVPPGARDFAAVLNSIGTARIPTQAQARNLREFAGAISSFKEIPNVRRIVADLDSITAAATKASRALATMPRTRSLSGLGLTGAGATGAGAAGAATGAAAAADAKKLSGALAETEQRATRARGSIALLGNGLGNLSGRFRLSYQTGTLFSAMFASFTFGQFVKGIYDANIQLLKLQKAMLFSTGSFADASNATDKYIGLSQELGLSIKDNINTYGRFVIATKAANIGIDQTNKIYHAVGQALTVVGASAQQQQLAFYGLTEMLQKGVVYSKEFNRQIGAQLPGNAILGARALSKLEGHVVTVTEFFQRMHSGTLLSPEFVPAWAAEVEKMYHPLLALAQARPDVAITRLNNAFFVFAREVGQGKFMSAIGREITSLMNKFVTMDKDGIAHLTPGAKQLADTLGNGLANAIHTLANTVGFLVDHFTLLFAALKGFFVFKLAEEFMRIGSSILSAAGNMKIFAGASREAAVAEAAVATEARAAAAASGIKAAATTTGTEAAAITMAATGFGGGAPRYPGAFGKAGLQPTAAQRTVTGLPLYSYAASRETTPTAMMSPQALRSAAFAPAAAEEAGLVSRAASTAAGMGRAVFSGLTTAMGYMGPLAIGAATALAIFSDQLTGIKTKAGSKLTFGDLGTAALGDIKDSIGGWVKDIANSAGVLKGVSASDAFGRFVAGLLGFGEAIIGFWPALAMAVGREIGGFAAKIIQFFIRLGEGIWEALHLRFGNAQAALAAFQGDVTRINKNVDAGVSKDMSITDFMANTRRIIAAGGANADQRTQQGKTDQTTNKNLEAAMRQQNAAAIIEAAAQKFEDATIGMDQVGKMLDPQKVLADLRAFAAGNITAGATPSVRTTLGAAGNADLKSIIAAAAASAGIDPNRLFAVGQAESGYNPKLYNYNKLGTSAVGPFQLTSGALSDLAKQGYDVSDPYSLKGAAPLAAAYLKLADKAAQAAIGRTLSTAESYIPYVMGPTGGAKFLNAFQQTPNATAANLFPSAAAHNPSLFYSKDNNGKYTVPLTMQESYAQMEERISRTGIDLSQEPTQQQLLGGEGGATAADGAKLNKVAEEAYKQVQGIISKGSPAAAASSEMQIELQNLVSIRENLQKAMSKESPFSQSFLADKGIMDGISHAVDQLQKKIEEANDPIAHQIALQAQSNNVLELRTKGLNAEADLQAEVNKLIEQGYTPDQAKAVYDRNLAAYKLEQNRTDVLTAQLDLQKQLNDIETHRMERLSNSGLQKIIDQQILAAAKPGENLAQTRDRLTQSGQMGLINQSASAQFDETRSESIQGLGEDLDVLRQGSGLNQSQQAYQADYIKALQGMTNQSTSSLARLSAAATDADKQIATAYASMKQQLENPPGFQKWVDSLEPFEKRLNGIEENFMNALSDDITNALSGDQVDWAASARDISKQILKANVDQMLSGTLQSLGLAQAKPEDTMSAAGTVMATSATTYQTSTMTFAQAVGQFAGTVATGMNAVGGASSSLSNAIGGVGMATGTTVTAPPANDNLSSLLRGAEDTGGSSGTPGGSDALLQQIQATEAANANLSAPLNLSTSVNPGDLISTLPPLSLPTQPGGGFFQQIGNFLGLGSGSGSSGSSSSGGLGSLGALVSGPLSALAAWLLKPNQDVTPTYHAPNGVIGAMSNNPVTATQVAGHPNLIGSILTMVANMAIGSAFGGASGSANTSGMNAMDTAAAGSQTGIGAFFSNLFNGGGGLGSTSNWLLNLLGMGLNYGSGIGELAGVGREGGYATQLPVHRIVNARTFRDVPHYMQGTHNTSEIPAILHPNEAVIPLSRGRKVPVEMSNDNQGTHVMNSTIIIQTPNPDGFRASRAAMQRQMDKDMRRMSGRNLTNVA